MVAVPRPFLLRAFAVVVLVCLNQLAPSQTAARTSRDAERYIREVLDLMQEHALHTKEIDWPAVREETLKRADGAQTTADTYPAIFYALTQLKEKHSFLRLPDNLTADAKSKAMASMGAILAPYKRQAPRVLTRIFTDRSDPAGHTIHVGQNALAYIVVPKCAPRSGDMQEAVRQGQSYANKLHAIAADLETKNPSGWIVDLRGNLGGDMYPMIAGIGFLLGEGRLGDFISPGSQGGWFYRNGEAGIVQDGREFPQFHVAGSPVVLKELPPVAVLVDGGTVSAGEAVAISFIGRPHTRFFGAHTFGLSTGNKSYPLPDGAALVLCGAAEADRDHHVYLDGIEPDVVLPEPPLLPAEEEDAALQAAVHWLLSLQGR
jgi:carboxyl-terminal processing protease